MYAVMRDEVKDISAEEWGIWIVEQTKVVDHNIILGKKQARHVALANPDGAPGKSCSR